LIAAVASYAQAKAAGGQWLLRIEDIDPPREVPGSAARIVADLQRFGMRSDSPVLYQSKRTEAYRHASQQLLDRGLAYWCGCSRSELPQSGVYPGTCRNGLPGDKRRRVVRLRVNPEPVRFIDRVQGEVTTSLPQTVGDFVIWRADGLPAYQLAVVVDDAFQHITEVVRGADLLASTARQIQLQRDLGLPTPRYAHHPVAVGPDGHKLSKRTSADPVRAASPENSLQTALRFLGQPCPTGAGLDLDGIWRWTLDNWRLSRVPRQLEIPLRMGL
jgi:glutamyl-Q tRNA(Asp) synthetase